MMDWKVIWEAHPDIFVARNWQECTEDRRKEWRLSPQFSYFMAGETALRVGIIACSGMAKEEEFLMAGMLWGNRLSNGAKTVIYFVASDFSPFFLNVMTKIGGNLTARAVYWREKLSPSLYLIPENSGLKSNIRYSLGEEKPDWVRWAQGLNPVAQQQLNVVKNFFKSLEHRRVRSELRPQQISFYWGNIEIAELKRRGKKFDLATKVKWEKDPNILRNFQKSGWVDASGSLNLEFCNSILNILSTLELKEKKGDLKSKDLLPLWLRHGSGVTSTLWGNVWDWPWLPKDRNEIWLVELSQWFYFQANGQLSVVCPILDRPLLMASQSIILTSVLERSFLLSSLKNKAQTLIWDGKVHWLTVNTLEEELRRWYSWLKVPEQFQIWVLPDDWEAHGINEITSRTVPLTI